MVSAVQSADFYPRSPCGERRAWIEIALAQLDDFYPRSPCGERRQDGVLIMVEFKFLSTLSLRRATTDGSTTINLFEQFLSTLSLRRATAQALPMVLQFTISIHALLAESDIQGGHIAAELVDFYPRSPCGERQPDPAADRIVSHFYPRSPCGERHIRDECVRLAKEFLSTLSLRRATRRGRFPRADLHYFYPRSPCGERLLDYLDGVDDGVISIHALLAESDPATTVKQTPLANISIHALLAESD